MITKKWPAMILICLLSQTLGWGLQVEVETLSERRFDFLIEDAVLGSFQEQGEIVFYPKIVFLHRHDTTKSGEQGIGPKEIMILNPHLEVTKRIVCNKFDRFGYSRKGNYFYRYSLREEEEAEQDYQGLLEVYSDRGDLVYTIDDLVAEYETGYQFYVSSKDGSVIIKKTTNPYAMVSRIEFYDKLGQKRHVEFTESEKHNMVLDFADNMKNMVSISMRHPERLPSGKTEPTVTYMDSSGSVMWERTLNEAVLATGGRAQHISAKGTYTYLSGYNYGDQITMNGYLYNRVGELEMVLPNGHVPLCFSSDENYLLINRAKPYEEGVTRKEIQQIYGMVLVDIGNKKVLFDEDREVSGIPALNNGAVSEIDGKVSFVQSHIGANKSLGNREFSKGCSIRVLDRHGHVLYDSELFYEDYARLVTNSLSWESGDLVHFWIDEARTTLRINRVQFTKK